MEIITLFLKSQTQVVHWNEIDFNVQEAKKANGIESTLGGFQTS